MLPRNARRTSATHAIGRNHPLDHAVSPPIDNLALVLENNAVADALFHL
jgi:hypothetical protein